MEAVLFDTSLYIPSLRLGDAGAAGLRQLAGNATVWLSAVVLEELYAGAGDRERPTVARLEADFVRADRIAVPNLSDWTLTGRVLERLADKYGYEQIGRGRLTNDALIAVCAGRLGIRILTSNAKDFRRLAEFRTFGWQVAASLH